MSAGEEPVFMLYASKTDTRRCKREVLEATGKVWTQGIYSSFYCQEPHQLHVRASG